MTKRVKMCLKYKYATDMEIIRKRCGPCPRNVNSKCQIIPKPAKTRTVKAWAILDVSMNPKSIIAVADSNMHKRAKDIPCTITIDRKYLKGANHGKR